MRTLRIAGVVAIVLVLLGLTFSLWGLSNRALIDQLLVSADVAADQFRLRFEASIRERLAALSPLPAVAAEDPGLDAARFERIGTTILERNTGFQALLLRGADGTIEAALPAEGAPASATTRVEEWSAVAEEAWGGVRLTGFVDLPGTRGLVAFVELPGPEGGRSAVVGLLSVKELVGGLAVEALRNRYGIQLRDDRGVSVFAHVDEAEEQTFDASYAVDRELRLGEQRIHLSLHPYSTTHAAGENVPGFVILALGCTLSIVLGGIVYRVGARAETLEGMVRERTVELEEKHRELEIEHRRALEASRLKSEFLANMTHELKSPIHSILTLAELLAEGVTGGLNDEQQKQVAFIRRSGDDLLKLIEQILTSARLDAEEVEVDPGPTDLGQVLRSLAEASAPLVETKHLEVEVDDALGGDVLLDEEKVRLVLGNLLSNAIKFTPDGGRIAVRARVADAGGPGPALEVAVSDTGIGIREDDQELIFEEFRQVDGSITRRFGGTGIGLAIARKLAERMKGGIEVESRPGEGSTFVVRLPLVRGTSS